MKIYILTDVYISPSGIHNKTGIHRVFSTLKSLLTFLEDKKENWEPNYEEGNLIYKNYFDLETFYLSSKSDKFHYMLYKNNLGYYNNPVFFKNKMEATKREKEDIRTGISCILKEIEIT